MSTFTRVAFAVAIVLSHGAAAQAPDTSATDTTQHSGALHRGDHVRLAQARDTTTLTGHLVRVDSADVMITPDDSTLPARTIPLVALTKFEVERGSRLRLVSTEIGAGLGTLAASAYYEFGWCRHAERSCALEQREQNLATQYDQSYFGVGTLFALAGMVAGGALGYVLAPAPHWEIIATPVLQRDRVGAIHDGMLIGVTTR